MAKKSMRLGGKRSLLVLAGALLVILVVVLALTNQAEAPSKGTTSDERSTTETTQTNQSSSSTTRPTTNPVNPSTPTQPATLSTCTYEGGPPSGRNCPATPPASYSPTVDCQAGGNPIACPDWSYTRRIAADYMNGDSFCLFSFWGDNGTGAQSKKVRVTNNAHPGSIPDCSVEQPLE